MPADAIKKLTEIIAIEKKHNYSSGSIGLREKPAAALNHVLVSGADNVVAIQLDKIGFADKVLVNGHNARRACDAVIFCQIDKQGFILILDLKSSTPSDDNHIPQLISGDCFADYLLAVLKRFEKIEVADGWQRRYFIFHCGNNKRTTLPEDVQNPPNNNRADKAHILLVNNGETISLRKLLNKPL